MVSDVPVGYDTSKVNTFTIGFDDEAKLIAEYLGTNTICWI